MTKAEKDREVRIIQAFKYLQDNDIDINSRSDLHYRNAIYIAAGSELNTIHAIQHKKLNGNNKKVK